MLHGCSKRLSEDLPHARLSAAYEECDRKMGMAWLFFTSATNHVLVHLSPAGVCGNEHNSFSFFWPGAVHKLYPEENEIKL